MAAQLRMLRRRIRSTQSIKKITRAMELIATSRIAKARAQMEAARPYAQQITRVLEELANAAALDHPLLVEHQTTGRAAVLIITSDRGQAGAYNANVLREAEQLRQLLRDQGKEPLVYVIGRKGVNYYAFRRRPIAASWTGFSEKPTYADAARVARTLVGAFLAGAGERGAEAAAELTGLPAAEIVGVDELHLVYTQFHNMVSQTPQVRRMAPIEVEYVDGSAASTGANGERAGERSRGPRSLYTFEPDPDTLFDALLPKYISARLYAALLESAASESASRQRAMKAATDNANELIRSLTLQANQARQAQITQEISEIVGGADALVSAGSDNA